MAPAGCHFVPSAEVSTRGPGPTASHPFGPWVTVSYQPWAPYSLGGGAGRDLTTCRTYGGTQTIDIAVYGLLLLILFVRPTGLFTAAFAGQRA